MRDLFTRMFLLPFVGGRFALQVLTATATDLEQIADRGLREIWQSPGSTAADTPFPAPAADAPREAVAGTRPETQFEASPDPVVAVPSLPSPAKPSKTLNPSPLTRRSDLETTLCEPINPQERTQMPDTNLNDNMVKLVEYKILTIEREQEDFLDSGTVIVTDDLTGDAFSNARVAEWTKENPDKIRSSTQQAGEGVRASTLRVYYSVLDRWPKEDLKKDEKEVTHFGTQKKELGELNESLKTISEYITGGGTIPPSGGSKSSSKSSSKSDS